MSPQAVNNKSDRATATVPKGWSLIGRVPPDKELLDIPLDSHAILIGRRSDTDLRLRSQRVSGHHAELLFVGETLFIRDLESTNGTFVNRRRVTQPMPVAAGDHIEIADIEFRVQYESKAQQVNENSLTDLKKTVHDQIAIDADWVLSQFNDLILHRQVTPHFQTIIDLRTRQSVGFEALARSSMVGLENPGKMFETAELVSQEVELSIICRERAIEFANRMKLGKPIFLNTHPRESMHRDVIPSIKRVQQHFPDVQIVVEFHEKTIQSANLMLENKALLKDIGVKIAYDDFGAGESRLIELMKAPPDYLKFDRCLIEDIDAANDYQIRMLKSLVDIAHEVGITTLAEGIETQAEAEICRDLGFEFGQGYFFGRPLENPIPDEEFPKHVPFDVTHNTIKL